MSTGELAVTMAFVAAALSAMAWWIVADFDREFGKSPRIARRRGESEA